MSLPLTVTFVSTLAFAIQLLIFAYLYSSHRVRFFNYLLWAWGAYTLSKGLKLLDVLVVDTIPVTLAMDVATVAAVGFTLAAALAHRWDYRLGAHDVTVGLALAVAVAAAGSIGNAIAGHVVGMGLGAVQLAAGVQPLALAPRAL